MTDTAPQSGSRGVADLSPLARRKEQRAWYWYDWANSAYVTTVAAVLFAPYLTAVADTAACGRPGTLENPCTEDITVLGLVPVSPGSLVFYVVTLATIVSALVLPMVGAAADRSPHKKQMMAAFAWFGSICAGLMFFVTGGNWQLGAVLLFGANIALGSSLVVYDAILCEIATPDERDRVSSRGWALGYLGGGILLAANMALVSFYGELGIEKALAVRISLLSAAAWWAVFTLIPYLGIRNRQPVGVVPEKGSLVRQSFGQLFATLRDLRNYPVTLTFLLAYLFYNDGIQTVIASSTVYGTKQLGFEIELMMGVFLFVQFVAFGGALLFGKAAERFGSRKVILGGLAIWMVVVTVGMVIPAKQLLPLVGLALGIGLVLGGTQAMSRSFFSQLIPRGREAEYFSLYQAAERGTSWLGALTFGVVHQLADSYRPAIFALILFFLVGGLLLWRVDPERGIREAGNAAPAVV